MARETSSGISFAAFFTSQNIIDLVWIFLAPAIFLGPYYFMTLPVGVGCRVQALPMFMLGALLQS